MNDESFTKLRADCDSGYFLRFFPVGHRTRLGTPLSSSFRWYSGCFQANDF